MPKIHSECTNCPGARYVLSLFGPRPIRSQPWALCAIWRSQRCLFAAQSHPSRRLGGASYGDLGRSRDEVVLIQRHRD